MDPRAVPDDHVAKVLEAGLGISSAEPNATEEPYVTHPLVVECAGRTHRVGSMTVYPDGHIFVQRHHTLSTLAARRAWASLLTAFGRDGEHAFASFGFGTRPTIG
jgi:hypothetical protein